jgi:DNA-directed RNA polymerase subunit beta
MDEESNEHFNIDTLSRMAEAQEKKKLAEEEAEKSADKNEMPKLTTADKPWKQLR